MRKAEKCIMILGAILLALATLFPPHVLKHKDVLVAAYQADSKEELADNIAYKYDFLFYNLQARPIRGLYKVDMNMLLAEWAAIIFLTFVPAIVLYTSRAKS